MLKGGIALAFNKPNYSFKGLNIKDAYLRISNLEYLYNQKKIAYLISVYANKSISKSEEETRLEDYYVGIIDLPLGGSVPDILRMIYEDIRLKAQDAEAYPEIAEKFADCADVLEEDVPTSPSYAELAAANQILMGGETA